jgi:mediator of RNA polymerase II transcription subunit 13, fungi type
LSLSSMYISPLEKNGPCLHLCYALDPTKSWLSAVWTDEFGHIALTMSYRLQLRHQTTRRSVSEIFQELWEISHDLMVKVRGAWRLAVVRVDHHEVTELSAWHKIFESSSPAQKRCLLILLSVQLNPELDLFPHPTDLKPTAQNQYGTPASTPQAGAGMTSPDQFIPATPTPGGTTSLITAATPPEPGLDPTAESDITLTDPSEESWSIILPYGINQSRNMTELRHAQVTGYLLTRRGTKHADGYNMLEISIIKSTAQAQAQAQSQGKPNMGHANMNATTPDVLLEDIIRQYRGLVTLAATRGCLEERRECLPWHIVTAVRGARVLGEVF